MTLTWKDFAVWSAMTLIVAALVAGFGLAMWFDSPSWLILSAIAMAILMAG